MRTLNPNERRLLLLLSAAVFVILNILLGKWFYGQTQKIQSRIGDLEKSTQEYEVMMQDRPHWEARKAWINSMPMDSRDGPETDSHFAEQIQRGLTQFGLSIEAQQLHEPENHGDLVIVSLDLTVKGRLEPIVRWMQDVQQPGKYFIIRAFTLKRFDEGANMSARMTVCRLFRRTDLASTP